MASDTLTLNRRLPRWARLLTVNVVGAAMVGLLLVALAPHHSFAINFLISLIYGNFIGTLAALVLPTVARRVAGCRGPLRWLVLVPTLLAVAVVGTALGALVIVATGVLPRASFGRVFWDGLWISSVVTLGFGAGMILYETTRARLDAATLALRTAELERERAERLAAQARLGALAARLQPHFLFNTLNAISALIPEDPERAERLVERFAGLLRDALDTTERPTVPLADEARIVTAYLDIEEARLGARLRASIDLPAELGGFAVPPLALQTLVENSIKHVAARRPKATTIRVRGHLQDGRLLLSVWDDGPGFSLDEIPTDHGLDNLRERLGTLFGASASLEALREDGGASVTVSLPAARIGGRAG